MNVSMKYHASVYDGLDADTAARNRAARAESTCSECGSNFGMRGGWDREAVEAWVSSIIIRFYYCQWDDHELYRPCLQCNPTLIISDDFTLLTPEQVAAWLGRACTCPDCARERKEHG